jgi:hypothetical protein
MGNVMDLLIQFVPLLVIGLVIGSLLAVAASKVGRSPVLWFILGVIPFVNFIFIWIATWSVLIDVHRRLKALESA